MAKEIVQYNANVAPSGISGEVFQPYKDAPVYKAPVMTPITLGADAFAADKKLGDAITDIGEQVVKIQNYNEQALALTASLDFKNQGLEAMKEAEKITGPNAVATEEQPGITDRYMAARTQQATDFIDAQPWSKQNKEMAMRTFLTSIHEEASRISSHEIQQNAVVNKQAIESVIINAASTMREYPLDDAKATTAMNGVAAVLSLRAPGDAKAAQFATQTLVEARLEGLKIKDPDKAAAFLEENKLLIGDKYDALRKQVTFSQIERDALINPGIALEKLGAMENGQPKFYQTLNPTERVAAVSGVISQVQGREALHNMEQKKRDEDSSYGYIDIVNNGIDPRNPQAVITPSQRGVAGIAYLNELVGKRLISPAHYEHLINAAKQGVTTDFESFQNLKIGVSLGKVSVSQIMSAEGVGAGDKAALLDHKRGIDNTNAQLGMMVRAELNSVRSMAERLMLPGGGIKPSDAQVSSLLRFNSDLNDAVKGGADPTQYYMSNGWKYMETSVPNTVKGTPKSFDDAQMMGYKLTQDYKLKRITESTYNIEAAKIDQAKRIFKQQEAAKAQSGEKRKTEKGR